MCLLETVNSLPYRRNGVCIQTEWNPLGWENSLKRHWILILSAIHIQRNSVGGLRFQGSVWQEFKQIINIMSQQRRDWRKWTEKMIGCSPGRQTVRRNSNRLIELLVRPFDQKLGVGSPTALYLVYWRTKGPSENPDMKEPSCVCVCVVYFTLVSVLVHNSSST